MLLRVLPYDVGCRRDKTHPLQGQRSYRVPHLFVGEVESGGAEFREQVSVHVVVGLATAKLAETVEMVAFDITIRRRFSRYLAQQVQSRLFMRYFRIILHELDQSVPVPPEKS